jgi:hypothetical protein
MGRASPLFAAVLTCCGAANAAAQVAPPRDVSANTAVAGTGTIRGRVVSMAAEDSAPLRNARVSVSSPTGTIDPIFTDGSGHFEFTRLAAGRYTLTAEKTGFVRTRYGSKNDLDPPIPIAVGDATAGDLEIRMPRGAAIAGRIVDELGDAVAGATMSVGFLRTTGAEARLVGVSRPESKTDDRGEYRVGGLAAGTYYVSVEGSSEGSQVPGAPSEWARTISWGRTFYFASASLAGATAVVLTAGEERTGIDLVIAPSRLRGRILTANERPARRASVWILPPTGGFPRTVVADLQGRYEFTEVPAGDYRLTASKPGYLALEYGQQSAFEQGKVLTIRNGETLEKIDITLPGSGAITGRVVDANGDAVEGISVRVMQLVFAANRRRPTIVTGAGRRLTNDQGQYRLYGVPPGQYIVMASLADQPAAQTSVVLPPGYAPTYAPDTPNASAARRVTVGLSEQVDDINITLAQTATARVSGMVIDSLGKPVKARILVSPSYRSGAAAVEPAATASDADGRFEIHDVPSGEWVLQASMGGDVTMGQEGEFVSRYVTVNGTDATDVLLPMSSGSRVDGRIVFEGNAAADPTGVMVGTLQTDFDLSPLAGPNAVATGQPDSRFVLTGLNGPRRLRVRAPTPWSLRAIRAGGQGHHGRAAVIRLEGRLGDGRRDRPHHSGGQRYRPCDRRTRPSDGRLHGHHLLDERRSLVRRITIPRRHATEAGRHICGRQPPAGRLLRSRCRSHAGHREIWRMAGPGVPGLDRAAWRARDVGRGAGGVHHAPLDGSLTSRRKMAL